MPGGWFSWVMASAPVLLPTAILVPWAYEAAPVCVQVWPHDTGALYAMHVARGAQSHKTPESPMALAYISLR